jgi:tetratricopeptide (TPR) repeat protein
MKPSRLVTMAAASLLVVCLGVSAMLSRTVNGLRPRATIDDVLYLKSAKTLRWLSLGYTGLMADIYWTRAVQYFGARHFVGAARFDQLAPLLDLTTDLDPKLTVAYQYGASFLSPPPPAGAGLPDQAVAIVEKGIRANPDNWHLYQSLGFIHYLDRKDYAAAHDAFDRGSKVPYAHPSLKLLAGRMAEKAGDIETARIIWMSTFDTTESSAVKENAANHLISIQAMEDITGLEKIVDLYRTQTGHLPASFRDMALVNMLPGLPLDPYQQPYVLNSDGHVWVEHPEKYKFLERANPVDPTSPLNSR